MPAAWRLSAAGVFLLAEDDMKVHDHQLILQGCMAFCALRMVRNGRVDVRVGTAESSWPHGYKDHCRVVWTCQTNKLTPHPTTYQLSLAVLIFFGCRHVQHCDKCLQGYACSLASYSYLFCRPNPRPHRPSDDRHWFVLRSLYRPLNHAYRCINRF